MTRMIHGADLHLTANPEDKSYSLSVLREILELVESEEAQFLLLSGDVFDSYSDLETLAPEFRKMIGSVEQKCCILIIAGNHEVLRMAGGSLTGRDLGGLSGVLANAGTTPGSPPPDNTGLTPTGASPSGVHLVTEPPFSSFPFPEGEILAAPHRQGYSDYRDWGIPPKRVKTRIMMIHASVTGLAIPGGDEEETSVVDPDLFNRFEVNYAAMGHIHTPQEWETEGTKIVYPGSARVWRRGETGPRSVVLLEIDDTVKMRRISLSKAGEYRLLPAALDLEGNPPDMAALEEPWNPPDWIEVVMSGVVEREDMLTEKLLSWDPGRMVRRFEIRRDNVLSIQGISQQPLARRFLDVWALREPEDLSKREIWLKARDIGLAQIKAVLEAKS